MFAPPDDDKARNKHVVLPGGVLSDAGSIPAASTFLSQPSFGFMEMPNEVTDSRPFS